MFKRKRTIKIKLYLRVTLLSLPEVIGLWSGTFHPGQAHEQGKSLFS